MVYPAKTTRSSTKKSHGAPRPARYTLSSWQASPGQPVTDPAWFLEDPWIRTSSYVSVTSRYCMLLHIITCYYMLLHVITCYYMLLHAITCYYMLLHSRGGSCALFSNVFDTSISPHFHCHCLGGKTPAIHVFHGTLGGAPSDKSVVAKWYNYIQYL